MDKKKGYRAILISIQPRDLKTLDGLAKKAHTTRSGLITDMTRLMAAVPELSAEIGQLWASKVREVLK